MNILLEKVKKLSMKKIQFKFHKDKVKIFEVGVGDSFCCKSLNYWNQDGFDVTLFEPNPFLYKNILTKIQNIKNIKLHNIGISNEEKIGELVCAGVLSYLKDIPSPINTIYFNQLNNIFEKFTIPVKLMKFNSFDEGNIDYLILGMEGAEFTVFENIISRPHIINMHNYFANDYNYVFPNFGKIDEWGQKNGYTWISAFPDILLINSESVHNNTISIYE